MLKMQSKVDVAMSISGIVREVQLYRSEGKCHVFQSRLGFPMPFVLLLFGFRFWLCQLQVFPNTYSPRDLSHLHCQQVSHWRMWNTLATKLRLQSLLWRLPRKALLPLLPARAKVSAQHLEQPHVCNFLLALSLSIAKRWKASPASCPQRQAIRQLV